MSKIVPSGSRGVDRDASAPCLGRTQRISQANCPEPAEESWLGSPSPRKGTPIGLKAVILTPGEWRLRKPVDDFGNEIGPAWQRMRVGSVRVGEDGSADVLPTESTPPSRAREI